MKNRNRSLMIGTTLGLALSAAMLARCSYKVNKPYEGASAMPGDVVSILEDRCVKCHSGSAANGNFNFVLDQAQLISAGYIVPGNPEDSILFQKISETPPYGARMPKGGPYLSAAELGYFEDWINSIGVTPSIAVGAPVTGSFIDSANSSASFPVTGSCNIKGAVVTFKVNGTETGSSPTCDGSTFSGTVDTTAAPFVNGANTISARMVKSSVSIDVESPSVSVTKDLTALSLAFTSPVNSSSAFRTVTGADPSFISDTTNSATYAVAGTCNVAGRTVTVSIDGATAASTNCDGTSFATTVNTTTLADGTHKFVAAMSDSGGNTTASSVYVFKFAAAPTIQFSTQVAPLLTAKCIDCHYLKAGPTSGSSSWTMGYWLGYDTTGGKPATPTGTDRSNFVFRFGYYKNTTNNPATNDPNYTRGFTIVNDATEAANTVRNRVVRGNPNQSFLYKKLTGAGPLCADGLKAKTDTASASNNQMPAGGPFFPAGDQATIYQWILEGARTDN